MGFFSDVFNAIVGSTGTSIAQQVVSSPNTNSGTKLTTGNIGGSTNNNTSNSWKPISTGGGYSPTKNPSTHAVDSSESKASGTGTGFLSNIWNNIKNNYSTGLVYPGKDYISYVGNNIKNNYSNTGSSWWKGNSDKSMPLPHDAKADTPYYPTASRNITDASVRERYRATKEKEAANAYMSGKYNAKTFEDAKGKNGYLTDDALLKYYGEKAYPSATLDAGDNYQPITDYDPISVLEDRANEARKLRQMESSDYIAKDYDEFVYMVNNGLIDSVPIEDAKGNIVDVEYDTTLASYNAYLKRKYADYGDDYYNRSYTQMKNDYSDFWEGKPEAFDADGNPIDTNVYLWLLNNPLARTMLQGLDASGNYTGTGPTMAEIYRDLGLVSEADVANMYAGHILAGDEMGVMLENNPELLSAILAQAYTPTVDPKNPVTYDVPMIKNPDGSKSRDSSKGVSGTLNLAEGYKTPAQLAAELIANPTSAEGMNNLQLIAAANELNKQNTTTPEKDKDENPSSPGDGPSGGDYGGGGGMPAGGNPETNDTLYSMPEVGNYAAQMILNRMLPTGYDYDYNKRLDKRLADIAAAEQNYKGSVLPTVERTYQDQAANTMANLVAALRANRASGLTSGASRGAQAASDVQAVQAASKENSEKLSKLINDNLAAFITSLANKRATAGNDTASELQGYASPMMTALGEVLAQYNYGSAAAQVNNGGLRRMQSYLV